MWLVICKGGGVYCTNLEDHLVFFKLSEKNLWCSAYGLLPTLCKALSQCRRLAAEVTFEKSGFNLSSTSSPSFSLCSQTYSTHNDGKVFLSCDLSNANLSRLTGATSFVKLLYTAVLEIVDKKALKQTF